MSDVVKIRLAAATPVSEGIDLLLKTVDGVDIHFLLDDMAGALLALTLNPTLHAVDRNAPNLFKSEENK